MRTIKKAQSGVKQKPVRKISVDNTSTGPKRNIVKDIKAERTTVANKNKAIVNKYSKEAKEFRDAAGTLFTMEAMNDKGKGDYSGVMALNKAAKTQDSLANVAKKNPRYKPALKSGGKVTKAKDGKWIQKAINPKHKGFCTPQTKKTCTPKRKALAQTLRKIAKKK
jgi:hypothetical protein